MINKTDSRKRVNRRKPTTVSRNSIMVFIMHQVLPEYRNAARPRDATTQQYTNELFDYDDSIKI